MVRKLEQRSIQIKLVQNHIDLNFIGDDFVGDDLTKTSPIEHSRKRVNILLQGQT